MAPSRSASRVALGDHATLRSPVVHTPLGDSSPWSSLDELVAIHTPDNSTGSTNTPKIHDHDYHHHRGSLDIPGDPLNEQPRYAIRVDPLQDDRAIEIKLLSCARPHMRAFHFSWLSFFIAFFGWFSIPPLMPTIKTQLNLTSDQVTNSNIASVASTIAGRIVIGPLCDRYGPRVIQTALLVVGALPVACAAFVDNYTGLMVVRFFIGLVGCTFVATSYWTSTMFAKQVVGSANALAAGWGNLGAGGAYLVTPLVFDLVTYSGFGGVSDDLAWRITLLFPALFMIAIGVLLYNFSDDCPHGNYSALASKSMDADTQDAASQHKPPVDLRVALRTVSTLPVTWILAFQYACSFGVELQVHNVLSLYYYEDFTRDDCRISDDATACRLLTQTQASLISSLFGLMCLFARAMGGMTSDFASRRHGMAGRITVQFLAFSGQAIALFLYARARSLAWSIPCLVLFGVFVQACTGTTFAIVPYVAPRFTGATSGLVGAGGNVGALCWGLLFKSVDMRATALQYLSYVVAAAALLCGVICVEAEESLWRRLVSSTTTSRSSTATATARAYAATSPEPARR